MFSVLSIFIFNYRCPLFKSVFCIFYFNFRSNLCLINSFILQYPNFCVRTCFNSSLLSWVESNFYIILIFWIFCYNNLLVLSLVFFIFAVRSLNCRFKFNKFPARICCNCWCSYINWSIIQYPVRFFFLIFCQLTISFSLESYFYISIFIFCRFFIKNFLQIFCCDSCFLFSKSICYRFKCFNFFVTCISSL